LAGFNVANYEVYADGAATPTATVTNHSWRMGGLGASSTHYVRLAYVLTDGRRSPAIGIAKSRAPRSVITGVVAAAAVAVLAGGIAAAAIGEREIAHHEESEDSGADATDSGTSGTSGTAGSGGDETSTSEGEGE
jgi:hypothetical protein